MEYIVPGLKSDRFWSELGYGLAELHKNTSDYFGLHVHNHIGRLPQDNSPKADWVDFLGFTNDLSLNFNGLATLVMEFGNPFKNYTRNFLIYFLANLRRCFTAISGAVIRSVDHPPGLI